MCIFKIKKNMFYFFIFYIVIFYILYIIYYLLIIIIVYNIHLYFFNEDEVQGEESILSGYYNHLEYVHLLVACPQK